MTDRDWRRFAAQVRALKAVECDDAPSRERYRRVVDAVNAARRAAGRPPLDEHPEPPELGLYARARALGLRRVDR